MQPAPLGGEGRGSTPPRAAITRAGARRGRVPSGTRPSGNAAGGAAVPIAGPTVSTTPTHGHPAAGGDGQTTGATVGTVRRPIASGAADGRPVGVIFRIGVDAAISGGTVGAVASSVTPTARPAALGAPLVVSRTVIGNEKRKSPYACRSRHGSGLRSEYHGGCGRCAGASGDSGFGNRDGDPAPLRLSGAGNSCCRSHWRRSFSGSHWWRALRTRTNYCNKSGRTRRACYWRNYAGPWNGDGLWWSSFHPGRGFRNWADA